MVEEKRRKDTIECLIEGYEDSDEETSTTISQNKKQPNSRRPKRVCVEIPQFNYESSSTPSFFASVASVEPENSISRPRKLDVLGISVGGFVLPQPTRTILTGTNVSSSSSTTTTLELVSKVSFAEESELDAKPHSGNLDEEQEEDLEDLLNQTTHSEPSKLSSLFTLPDSDGTLGDTSSEQDEPLPVQVTSEKKEQIVRDVSVTQATPSKPSIWSTTTSGVSSKSHSSHLHEVPFAESGAHESLEIPQQIQSESIPKGKEWKGLVGIESSSATSISLSSDDLRNPEWRRQFDRGDGKLKKKPTIETSWNIQKGQTERIFEPSRRQKQKHQINWLAQDAANRELDVLEKSAQQKASRYQTAMKYGW